MVLVHSPNSEKELQIQNDIISWMKESSTSFKALSSEQFIQKLCNVYMEKAAQSCTDSIGEAIKNLCSVKYMAVDESSGDVSYSFPSDFTSLCINQVVTKTQKWWNSTFSCKEQPPVNTRFPDIFKKVLASTNSNLSSLRQDLKKMSNTIVEKESFYTAVKSLSKSKGSYDSDDNDVRRLVYRKRGTQPPKPKPVSLSGKAINDATNQLTSNIMDDLCKEVFKLSVDDIGDIPDGLTFEAAVVMLKLTNMGKQKPKTVGKLRNALKVTCQFMAFVPLWNVKAVGKNCPPKKAKRTSPNAPAERQIIKLKSKAVQVSVSLEPDTFLEDVKIKKKDKKADKDNETKGGMRPGDKRRRSSDSMESSKKQVPNAETAKRLSAFNKSLTSRANTNAQQLSTFTIPANEDAKMKAVGKIREIIASTQRPVEPMETNGNSENDIPVGQTKAQLLEDLIKACIQVETFPKEEMIKSLTDAGVISLPQSGPMKVSDDIQDKVKELQEKRQELQRELQKKLGEDDQNTGKEQRTEEIENATSLCHQTDPSSVVKHRVCHNINTPLVLGAIFSVVLAIYVAKVVFYT